MSCDQPLPGTHTLSVEIETLPFDTTTFHYPKDIEFYVSVAMTGPLKASDTVSVELFADAKSIGKGKTQWHPAEWPPNRPGQAYYMHVVMSGFSPVPLVWKHPAAGHYTLIAKATFYKSLTATSAPVSIVVTP